MLFFLDYTTMKKNYWQQEDAFKTALAEFDGHFFLLCM